ncbi:hypothetical protein [Steroidobacter sp.]|uniref:hypothetical protein n=1 Tax=Steroidobacter sp. TaxID=1978227 RepID=UPI001A4558DB|nr:hypothetical protein [Steroidobacter sp.]MBL8266432.1 hypothetical protein [Steroidobacter sp.]
MKNYPRTIGLGIGALYGLLLRLMFEWEVFHDSYEIVSASFLLLAPFATGAIAVFFGSRAGRLSVGAQIGTAAGTMLFFLIAMFVLFIEGLICIVLVLPVFTIASVIGGLVMGLALRLVRYNRAVVSCFALLPVVFAPLESQLIPDSHERTVVNTLVIDSSAENIWNNLISVADIQKQELGWSFTHAMGVPRPLQAAMNGAGVGAVRTSQWEKGVQFKEVVTQWQPPYRLSYDFDIPPNSIPRDALDRHVEIGGEYFTVVSGGYSIRPLSAEQCEVTLRTTYANRSNLKLYGDLWGDFVFDDFHRSILRLIQHRSERADRVQSF